MLALSEEGVTVIGLAEEPLPRCEIRSQTQKKKNPERLSEEGIAPDLPEVQLREWTDLAQNVRRKVPAISSLEFGIFPIFSRHFSSTQW
jgi:hypothetical protein